MSRYAESSTVWRACVVPLILLLVAWSVLAQDSGRDAPRGPFLDRRPPAVERPLVPRVEGAGSCSAAACHGGIAPLSGSPTLRNEHTTWITDDPHSRAFQVLFEPRSAQIIQNLAGGRAPVVAAYHDAHCLACHATPRPEQVLTATRAIDADGVGCESCHGAADRWLGPHTTSSWRDLDSATKQRDYGFLETKDLRARAKVCAGCHVGQFERDGLPRRDVNHDLIAAGHPRLTFELAAYLDRYPPHWVEKGRNADGDFPARAWAAGQVVTAQASLELLRDRASHPRAVWPEFAEYGCFSCHHSLLDAPWRSNRPLDPTQIGRPQWGTWPMPMLRRLARTNGRAPAWSEFLTRADELEATLRQPESSRSAVAALAASAAATLDRVDLGNWGPDRISELIRAWNAADAWRSSSSWDDAAGRYLALVPLLQAWTKLDPFQNEAQAKLHAELEAVLQSLRYASGFESPSGFDPSVLPTRP
jgi:hypothetical protein